jgi:iron-sulfur cluster biosynthesis transcriptional regulator SufR
MSVASGSNILINKQMPATRRRILILLKERGQLTADQLADLLAISAVAVRRHLTKLERDQLVAYKEVQRGMGRPSFVYELGEAADNFFPRRYQELALNVLETVKDLYGNEAIDAVFQVRAEQAIERYRRKVTGQTLERRLDQLTRLREADGYMSSWQVNQDGSFVLREANCPIFHAAEGCDSACNQDMMLLENLLDADVLRTQHLVVGDGACCYTVRPRTPNQE